MNRLLAVPAIVAVTIVTAIGAAAASTSAQMVNCAATTWCFNPNPIMVTAGSTVTWRNGTLATHTATSDTNAWTTGNVAPGSTSPAIAFNTPGTFAYHCAIHPFMTGTVVVAAASAASPTVRPASPPVVTRLAQGGAGPAIPIAALLMLVGIGLLRPMSARRRPRGR